MEVNLLKFYLYKITNSVNDKVYIGITSRPELRWKEHLSKSSKCTKLRNAMNKHGREHFKMELLCIGLEDYILELEKKSIILFNSVDNGYNVLYGSPNELGTTMPEDVKKRLSGSLLKFYKDNPNYLKENRKPRKSKFKDVPVFVSGFWFKDREQAMSLLRMNIKTFIKRQKLGTLGDVFQYNAKSVSHSPVYVLGLWFDSLLNCSYKTGKSLELLQHLVRSKDLEEDLKRIGSRPRLQNSPKSIGVTLRENGKYRSKMFIGQDRIFDKTFSTELEAAEAYDNHYEEIYGVRPNKTVRDNIP